MQFHRSVVSLCMATLVGMSCLFTCLLVSSRPHLRSLQSTLSGSSIVRALPPHAEGWMCLINQPTRWAMID
ncbi:hypothetical protein F5Y14DRAFT_70782 [Nemania sp. NC0429]|nr:hypothetical protein F5Y14DRAFT_70782 [Nemania sp. NC0429]